MFADVNVHGTSYNVISSFNFKLNNKYKIKVGNSKQVTIKMALHNYQDINFIKFHIGWKHVYYLRKMLFCKCAGFSIENVNKFSSFLREKFATEKKLSWKKQILQ